LSSNKLKQSLIDKSKPKIQNYLLLILKKIFYCLVLDKEEHFREKLGLPPNYFMIKDKLINLQAQIEIYEILKSEPEMLSCIGSRVETTISYFQTTQRNLISLLNLTEVQQL